MSITDHFLLHNENNDAKPPLYNNTQKLKGKFECSSPVALKTMKSLKRVVKVSKEEWKQHKNGSPTPSFDKIISRKQNNTDLSSNELWIKSRSGRNTVITASKSLNQLSDARNENNESNNKQGLIGKLIIHCRHPITFY